MRSMMSMRSMIFLISMISMILSVFSCFPFVGAYLRSFSGHFCHCFCLTYCKKIFYGDIGCGCGCGKRVFISLKDIFAATMDCDTSKTNEEGFVQESNGEVISSPVDEADGHHLELVHYLILGASGLVIVLFSVIAGYMWRRFYKSRIIQELQREELEIRHLPALSTLPARL